MIPMTTTASTTTPQTWVIEQDGMPSPSFGPYELTSGNPAEAASLLLADIFGDVARGRTDGTPISTNMEVDNVRAVVTIEWCDLDAQIYTIEYVAEVEAPGMTDEELADWAEQVTFDAAADAEALAEKNREG